MSFRMFLTNESSYPKEIDNDDFKTSTRFTETDFNRFFNHPTEKMQYKFNGDFIKIFSSKEHVGTYNKKTRTLYANDLKTFNK